MTADKGQKHAEAQAIANEIKSLESELALQRQRDKESPLPVRRAHEAATSGRIAELRDILSQYEATS